MSTSHKWRKEQKLLERKKASRKGRYVAYYRVSTEEQGISGLGLEAQQATVNRFLAPTDVLVKEVTEVQSGTDNERPLLQEALRLCEAQDAYLIVARLDRLGRNLRFIADLLKQTPFIAVDMPHAGVFEVHIRGALAEEEHRLISSRTKAALAAAKARGVKLGGYRGGPVPVKDTSEFRRQFLIHVAMCKDPSPEGVSRHMQRAKFLSPQGRPMTPSVVRRWMRVLRESPAPPPTDRTKEARGSHE